LVTNSFRRAVATPGETARLRPLALAFALCGPLRPLVRLVAPELVVVLVVGFMTAAKST
jgi:hypothetical protein